jgi:hypothetical protein
MKVLAKIVFSWDDDDPDSAIEELRRAGYAVHRTLDVGIDGCDFVEAIIDGSNDDKIRDAIWHEIRSILERHGGLLEETLMVDEKEYVPFKWYEYQWRHRWRLGTQ